MSAENVEVVRRAYAAWNRGDLEIAFGLLDSRVEVSPPPMIPEAGTLRGRDEARRVMEEFLSAWDEIGAEPQEFVDAGDKVVVLVRMFGRGKGSGAVTRGRHIDAHLWTLREGKAIKLEMYSGTEAALKAAGVGNRATGADQRP